MLYATLPPPQPKQEIVYAIRTAAVREGLDPDLLQAIAMVESGLNPLAINNRSGSVGLFQFMPRTAKAMGVRNRHSVEQSARGAAKYLRLLLDQFDGNEAQAVAAYNAGPAHVAKHNMCRHARAYTGKVARAREKLRRRLWEAIDRDCGVSGFGAGRSGVYSITLVSYRTTTPCEWWPPIY